MQNSTTKNAHESDLCRGLTNKKCAGLHKLGTLTDSPDSECASSQRNCRSRSRNRSCRNQTDIRRSQHCCVIQCFKFLAQASFAILRDYVKSTDLIKITYRFQFFWAISLFQSYPVIPAMSLVRILERTCRGPFAMKDIAPVLEGQIKSELQPHIQVPVV